MSCNNCVHHLEEKDIEQMKDRDNITVQFNKEKKTLKQYLRDGEVPVFCMWTYTVMGSNSVCADIEVADE